MEKDIEKGNSCEYNRLYDDKNYVFYDDTYLGPGYLIVNIKNRRVNKFLKIYSTNDNGFPLFAIRAYSLEIEENFDEEFSSIDFIFENLEDDETGLYDIFAKLAHNLEGKSIFSINPLSQGKNNLKLYTNTEITKITLSKDNYNGNQHPIDYIDILIGDELSCDNYYAVLDFYNEISRICMNKFSLDEVKKLVLL
ncbi:MAG: hypothetical protein ACI33S_03225 [Bacilli bacterium]